MLDSQRSALGARCSCPELGLCASAVVSFQYKTRRNASHRARMRASEGKGRRQGARSSSKELSGSASRIAENNDTAYPHRTHVSNTSKKSVIGCPIAQPMRTSTGRMHSDTWIDEPTAIDMERLSLSLTETVTAVTCSTELPGTGTWDQFGSLPRRMRRWLLMRMRRRSPMRTRRSVLSMRRVED